MVVVAVVGTSKSSSAIKAAARAWGDVGSARLSGVENPWLIIKDSTSEIGPREGTVEGRSVGPTEGTFEGGSEGTNELVTVIEGMSDGTDDTVGTDEGVIEGMSDDDGDTVGINEGRLEGRRDGTDEPEGNSVLGIMIEGPSVDGAVEGTTVASVGKNVDGADEGTATGENDGANDAVGVHCGSPLLLLLF